MTHESKPLFVWRDSWHATECGDGLSTPATLTSVYGGIPDKRCPFCNAAYHLEGRYIASYNDRDIRAKRRCLLCGFWFQSTDFARHWSESAWTEVSIATLRAFDINSPELALTEIGSHLRRDPNAMQSLNPRRFEEFVEDVFRNHGFTTCLTQATRDGGYDIVLESRSGELCLVECKRHSTGHPVRVAVVRQLLGVQLLRGVHKAKIVTSTSFTRDAVRETSQLSSRISGFELELIDASRLLTMLGTYDATLPPLNLNPQLLAAIDV